MSTRKVRLFAHVNSIDTEKARAFHLPENREKRVWIPRSLTHHVTRNRADVAGYMECLVEVEEWFADKEDL